MAKSITEVTQATLASVRAQLARSNTTHASTNLVVRHAMHHAADAKPGILHQVCESVRDELAHEFRRSVRA